MNKISIITVTYNAGAVLEKTIKSVLSQDYPHIEHIIIDGGSTDNTLSIVQAYAPKLAHWRSEKDKGIYDAMNKGIGLATGEWLNFMNAGDIFSDKDTLSKAFRGDEVANADVLYGNYRIVYQTFSKNKLTPAVLLDFAKGMCINHQSCLVRKNVATAFPFDLNDGLAADFGQLLRAYAAGKRFVHLPFFVANYADGGESSTRKITYLNQCLSIATQVFPEQNDILQAHYQATIAQTKRIAQWQAWLPLWLFEALMRLKNLFFLM